VCQNTANEDAWLGGGDRAKRPMDGKSENVTQLTSLILSMAEDGGWDDIWDELVVDGESTTCLGWLRSERGDWLEARWASLFPWRANSSLEAPIFDVLLNLPGCNCCDMTVMWYFAHLGSLSFYFFQQHVDLYGEIELTGGWESRRTWSEGQSITPHIHGNLSRWTDRGSVSHLSLSHNWCGNFHGR